MAAGTASAIGAIDDDTEFPDPMIENANLVAVSRQMALSRQMDVVANNLANINTTSFKRHMALLAEYPMRLDNVDQPLSFVFDVGTHRDPKQGEVKPTGNPLDIAIVGAGFLVVETPKGERYTRNGNLRLNSDGELATASGYLILDDNNSPIVIDNNIAGLTIAKDGTVSNDQGPLGKLAVVRFRNEQAMKSKGEGLYETEEAPIPVEEPDILQGMLESSNVQPILEMTRMIEIARAYSAIANLVKKDDDMRRAAIQKLGRTPMM